MLLVILLFVLLLVALILFFVIGLVDMLFVIGLIVLIVGIHELEVEVKICHTTVTAF